MRKVVKRTASKAKVYQSSGYLSQSNYQYEQKRNYTPSMDVVGGRSSQSGIVATVFGCTGMMGNYVVPTLGSFGSNIVVPFRGELSAINHLKPAGDIGQIVPIWYSPYHKESIRRAIQHSSLVINMIGASRETKNYSLEDANIETARNIAEVCAEKDVRYIHLSAMGADPLSPSRFARTKGEAELVVRSILPKATIIRPAPVFCMQDNWLNRIGLATKKGKVYMHSIDTRVQPIYAADLTNMIMSCVLEDFTQGKIIEACGPTIYTLAQIYTIVQYIALREDTVTNFVLSDQTARFMGTVQEKICKYLWKTPSISNTEVEWYQSGDLVETGEHMTRRDLGYTTDKLSNIEEIAVHYIKAFRDDQRQHMELKHIHHRDIPFLKQPNQ